MSVSYICETCENPAKNDKAITCDVCGDLVHAACENLQQVALKGLKKNKRMQINCIR